LKNLYISGFTMKKRLTVSRVSTLLCVCLLFFVIACKGKSTASDSGGTINQKNVNLSALTLSNGTIAFDQQTTVYNVAVANGVSSMTVTPSAADPSNVIITVNGSAVVSGSMSNSIDISIGSGNIIKIRITSKTDAAAYKDYTINVTRKASVSANADLADLQLSVNGMSPSFSPSRTSYNMEVAATVSSLTVTPTVAESFATVTVNGTPVASGTASSSCALASGSNTITVAVTAENGTVKKYIVVVTRLSGASANADLSRLTVSTGSLSPLFKPNTTTYSVEVPNSITSLSVTPTVAGVNATVKVNSKIIISGTASAPISIVDGNNTISVDVTAENGATRSYKVVVVRIASTSTNSSLSGIGLSSGVLAPNFSSIKYSYAVELPVSVSEFCLTPIAAGYGATISVNGTMISSGTTTSSEIIAAGTSKTYNILVTAASGASTTYTVVVTRLSVLSSNADLSGLSVKAASLSPEFSASVVSYSATVNYQYDSTKVYPVASSLNATITVNGTTVASGCATGLIPLSVGSNSIQVVVTAENGSSKTYSVAVTRSAQCGLTWELKNIGVTNNLNQGAWSGSLFSITGSNSVSITSADGESWNIVNAGGADYYGRLHYVSTSPAYNIIVVYGTGGKISVSNDLGTTWSEKSAGTTSSFNGSSSYGVNRFYLVGYNGTIAFSSDQGNTWTLQNSGVTDNLLSIAITYVSGTYYYIIVGDNGTILRSTDGSTWTKISSGGNTQLRNITMPSSSMIIAYGDNGVVLTSADYGLTWTQRTTGSSERIHGLSYVSATSKYLLAGRNGLLMTSPDAITWTAKNPGTLQSLQQANYYLGKYIATAYNGVVSTSTDGESWSTVNTGVYENLGSMVFNSSTNKILIRGNNGIFISSADAANWSQVALGTDEDIVGSFGGNGTSGFWNVGMNQTVMYSADGETGWTIKKAGTDYTVNSQSWVTDKSMFIAAGSRGTIATSPDGSAWTVQSTGTTLPLLNCQWTGTKFIAVGRKGTVMTSPDAVTWTSQSTGITEDLSSSSWISGLGMFVADTRSGDLYTSTDGVSWIQRISGSGSRLSSITFNGTAAVAIGNAGLMYASTDGISWSKKTPPVIKTMNMITTIGTRFVAIGQAGLILTSDDNGDTWVQRTSGTVNSLNNVLWDSANQLAVVAGDYGTILTSPDGTTWTKKETGTTNNLSKVRNGNGKIIVFGERGAMLLAK
jgi:photosystem II stability/assembly factor-like uncharacterized protein